MALEPPLTKTILSQKETGIRDRSDKPSVGDDMLSPFQKTEVCLASVPLDERVDEPPGPYVFTKSDEYWDNSSPRLFPEEVAITTESIVLTELPTE